MVAVIDSPDYFSVQVSETGDEPVVVVKGEIDLHAAEPLWDAITVVLARAPKRLVVDLVDTTFMDSSGLEVLVRAHNALGRLPEATVLRAVSPAVRRVLEMAGLVDLFAYDGNGNCGDHGGDDDDDYDGAGDGRGGFGGS